MKILSIYYTDKPGGFCKRLYRLLGALVRQGHEVTYLTLDKPPTELSPQVTVKLIPFPLQTRQGTLFWLIFTCLGSLFVVLTAFQIRPARIVVFGAYYSTLSYPAKKLFSIPIVLFIRSLVFKINRITEKSAFQCWCSDTLERFGMKCASRLIAMSNSMALALHDFIGTDRKIEILPNDCPLPSGGELPAALRSPILEKKREGRLLCLISGVFDQRKNLALVVNAFIILHKLKPAHRLELLVAGSGPEIEGAQATWAGANATGVTFLGWVKPLEALMPLVDLVIHPSKHEGMPNSVLEAWGNGVPTLLADIPELREMVVGEDLLFDTSSPEFLVKKLLPLVESPEQPLQDLRLALEASKARFLFDWDKSAGDLVTFFEDDRRRF